MARRKILTILNPVAGKTDPKDVRQLFEGQSKTGLDTHIIYETGKDDDVAAIVKKKLKDSFDLVIAAGGDGTVSSVAAALVNSGVPLGILPTGTANALAQDLGIPHDLVKAKALIDGNYSLRPIDVLQCGDAYYLLNIGVGLTSRLIKETNREQKSRFGYLAYIIAGLKNFIDNKPHQFFFSVDGVKNEAYAVEMLIVNSPVLGTSLLRIGQECRIDDGRIELFIMRPKGLFDYLKIAAGLVFKREKISPNITILHAHRTITIDSDKELLVQGDGDIIAKTPIMINLIPRSVKIVVPKDGLSSLNTISNF